MRKFLVLLFILGMYAQGYASADYVKHEYIASLKRDIRLNTLNEILAAYSIQAEVLNAQNKIYLLKFINGLSEVDEQICLKKLDIIQKFHPNKILKERNCKPNDPFYNKQWNLAFMGFEEVWCFNNNGITPLGDTIVLGIIDQGCNCDITDISANLFINHKEIPNNNLDDDSNGYMDDYRGFNAVAGKGDKHPPNNHGTNVLSIAGANGNNGKFITGAAPKIKMLMCSASSEADAIECYYYFLKMKEDYYTFKGQFGAYLVASSTSLGLPEAFPEDHSAWCDVYDQLGTSGIINICATDNVDENIDNYGDIPGLCKSDYLIVVTNTDRSDTRAKAAFSKINVDLAASGELVPVMNLDSSVENSSGCSLSAPQVAAGAAYLHQFGEKYAKICKSDPPQSALLMKNFILEGSKPIPALSQEISSGKRFDVNGAFTKLLSYCEILSTEDNIMIKNTLNSIGSMIYDVNLKKFGNYTIGIYDIEGRLILENKYHYNGQPQKDQTLDVKGLSYGLYLVVLKTDEEKIAKKMVIAN